MQKKYLVTGGAGFIGINLINRLLESDENSIINVDKLSYASHAKFARDLKKYKNYELIEIDIADADAVFSHLERYNPDHIFHLAAESHVDNSILNPRSFIDSNIIGTFNLLQLSLKYQEKNPDFIFQHISTDEVFGSLTLEEKPFTEGNQFKPNSPYSASKASSDHFVRAWGVTHNLRTITTNCSNNFGPFQHKEKLIPKIIFNAFHEIEIPIYGNGKQIRDWLFVGDHVDALIEVSKKGKISATYNIGGGTELENLSLAKKICSILEINYAKEFKQLSSCSKLITHVQDRPGHDERYSIDFEKIKNELDWIPSKNFDKNLLLTIDWFIELFREGK